MSIVNQDKSVEQQVDRVVYNINGSMEQGVFESDEQQQEYVKARMRFLYIERCAMDFVTQNYSSITISSEGMIICDDDKMKNLKTKLNAVKITPQEMGEVYKMMAEHYKDWKAFIESRETTIKGQQKLINRL